MPGNYEVNMAKYNSDIPGDGTRSGSGCHCSVAVGFVLVLLAVAIAVGVGIIVHFAEKDGDVVCNYKGVPLGEMNVMACVGLASQGKNPEICDACPEPTTITTTIQPDETTTTAMATTAPPTEYNRRLPTTVTPILYTVYLRPEFYSANKSDWKLPGRSTVLIHCDETTDVVTMNIKDIAIEGGSSITVILDGANTSGGTAAPNLYENHSIEEETQFLHIRMMDNLVKGNNYTIDISFTAQIRWDETGVYIASYPLNDQTVYVITTQMEATEARKMIPCFDEPAMKAQFDVTVARQPDKIALSNAPLKSSTDVNISGSPWVEDTFERTPVMSTYLLALTISDYKYTQLINNNGLKIRLWVRPEAINQTEYGVKIGSDVLSYFEGYFDAPFPIAKLDMFAINNFAFWAMENWGLIIFREDTLLYEETKTSPSEQFLLTIRLSHEISHNWFGNLVSPNWWDDLWLNEGFATFVSTIGVDLVQPDWKVKDFFVHVISRPGLISDARVVSHPLYITGVSDPDEILTSFDNIMYEKGASVIRMLEFMLGGDTFKRGLQRYLKQNAFGNAKHEDLWDALSEQAENDNSTFTDVKTVMDTWVKQMNYPLVNVEFGEEGTIRLTQRRYLVNPDAEDPMKFPSAFGYKWEIPFTYTTSVEQQFEKTSSDVIMMHGNDSAVSVQSDTIPAPTGDNWVIANLQYIGFFRVNYDARNWDAIIKQLNTDHTAIHSSNRAQILMDTWSLSKSGELELVMALRATEYIGNELELAPWNTFVANMDELNNVMYKYPVYGPFKNFLKDILRPAYTDYAITSTNANATFIERYIRQLVVGAACSVDLDDCVSQAKVQFQEWSGATQQMLHPSVAGTVYCTGVRHGGEAEWNYVFQKYKEENLRSEKYYLLRALTCTREPWLITKVMDKALEGTEIIISDFARTFEYLSYTVAAPMAWDFFRKHYQRIFQQSGPYWGLTALQMTVAHFNNDKQIDELETFGEDAGIVDASFYMNALEKAKVQGMWLEANVDPLTEWLATKGY